MSQDRAWLLNAIYNIRAQVEKVRQAENNLSTKSCSDTEVHKLLAMFEEETLNHIGDE